MISLTSLAIRFAAGIPDIERYDRFLFVGPHPDDIEIGAGATAAKLAAMGKKVTFLICTDGRYGDGNVPNGTGWREVADIRRKESIKSAEVLGITDVRFLELSDGAFYTMSELETGLARAMGEVRPDVVFAPDPRVKSECHPDHLNTGNAVSRIAYFAPYSRIMKNYGAESADVKAVAYYMTADINHAVNTTGFFEKQLQSVFDCHKSQFPHGSADERSLRLYLKIRNADMGLRKLCRNAEGFRVQGRTHMHCLPEAR